MFYKSLFLESILSVKFGLQTTSSVIVSDIKQSSSNLTLAIDLFPAILVSGVLYYFADNKIDFLSPNRSFIMILFFIVLLFYYLALSFELYDAYLLLCILFYNLII